MARTIGGPRKQRTRQHVIADQSVNHVERLIIDEGHTAQRMEKDYGYDLLLFTYDEQGYVEPGLVSLQEWRPDWNTDRTPLRGPTVGAVAQLRK